MRTCLHHLQQVELLISNSHSHSLMLMMRNILLLDVSPVKPVIVEDEAGVEPEQKIDNGHDCTEHHLAVVIKHSGEVYPKNDNVKDDTEDVDN